jgi:hypothetical protein
MELVHLVALDNHMYHEIFPLNSTTIYPKPDHTLYCVLTSKTKCPSIYLFIEPLHFAFLFLLFQVGALDHLLLGISITVGAI